MSQLRENFVSLLGLENTFFVVVGVWFLLVIYFLPGLIGTIRHTRNHAQVRVINIFLWRTFVGRVIALAMAFSPHIEGATTETKSE